VTHKEWELMEFSIVPIPALPSAIAQREWDDFTVQCKEYGHPVEEAEEPSTTIEPEDREMLGWDETNVIVGGNTVKIKYVEPEEEKAGRVLSKKNRSLISDAVDKTQTAVGALKDLLEKTDDQPKVEVEDVAVENQEDLAGLKVSLEAIKLKKEIGEIRSIGRKPEAPDAQNTLN